MNNDLCSLHLCNLHKCKLNKDTNQLFMKSDENASDQ